MALSIYVDTFKRPDSSNISSLAPMGGSYTAVTSTFSINSGYLFDSNLTEHVATCDAPVMNTADYYVQADVYTNPSYGSGVGVIGRYASSGNFYYARINTIQNDLQLFKRVSGSDTNLATFGGGYVINVFYTLKLEFVGTTINVYVNGTKRITVTDSTFSTAGKPGFWTDYGYFNFTNFIISSTNMTKTAIPSIGTDYSQPALPTTNSGWKFNSIDEQVVTKSDGWNQDSGKRTAEMNQLKSITGITHVAMACPYDNLTKYINYVADARTAGLKVYHRSHWNGWEGDNNIPASTWRQDYLEDTYRFITTNPTLFAAGDLFGVCVEPNNADNNGINISYPFRAGNVVGGAFDITQYNTFCKDQVRYANAAFTAIGLGGQIYTFPISGSVSLLNLGGQNWTNTSGDNSGLGDSDFVTYFGGYCAIDHYESDATRDGQTYYTAYNNDITKWALGFPNCKLFIGELGYHTTTQVQDGEQLGVIDMCLTALRSKTFIIGFSSWVHMASNTASSWNDSGGSIVPGGRRVVEALRLAFGGGNQSNGVRVRATGRGA